MRMLTLVWRLQVTCELWASAKFSFQTGSPGAVRPETRKLWEVQMRKVIWQMKCLRLNMINTHFLSISTEQQRNYNINIQTSNVHVKQSFRHTEVKRANSPCKTPLFILLFKTFSVTQTHLLVVSALHFELCCGSEGLNWPLKPNMCNIFMSLRPLWPVSSLQLVTPYNEWMWTCDLPVTVYGQFMVWTWFVISLTKTMIFFIHQSFHVLHFNYLADFLLVEVNLPLASYKSPAGFLANMNMNMNALVLSTAL